MTAMLKVQRAAGLLLVALGGAFEASALAAAYPAIGLGSLDAVLPARCAAVFGAALYALTMTGRLRDALPALLPVPVLAPLAAVVSAWRRGDLSRPALAPRRLIGFGEAAALAVALAALDLGGVKYGPALFETRPAVAQEAARPAAPASRQQLDSLGTISYQVDFHAGTAVIKDESSSVLGRVADTMHYYPLDEVLLAARSPTADAEDLLLAERRLAAARRVLADRGLDPERVKSQVRFGAGPAATVDIFIIGN